MWYRLVARAANPDAGILQSKVNMYLEGIGVLMKHRLIDPSLARECVLGLVKGPYRTRNFTICEPIKVG